MARAYSCLVSADLHVVEPPDMWSTVLGTRFGERTPRVLNSYRGRRGPFFFDGTMVVNAHNIIGAMEEFDGVDARVGHVPEARVAFQQAAGITAEVINATFMSHVMFAANDPANRPMVRAAAQVFNDWFAEYASHDRNRLVANAEVPTDDVDFAAAEFERVRNKGLRGVIINAAPPEGCPPYRDRGYDRLWAAAQALNLPVTLHIVTGRVPDAIHLHTPEEIAKAPGYWCEIFNEVQAILANDFIFGGILDRFPGLKLVCAEYEINWIPNFVWRLEQLQGAFGKFVGLPPTKLKPGEYMQTRIWHGLVDDPFGAEAIRRVGASQIMWGSDFPHPRAIGIDAQARLAKAFADLPRADQEKIVGSTAAGVYGIA